MAMVAMAAVRLVEGVDSLQPRAGFEPGHAFVVAALNLTRRRGLVRLVPVLDTIVHPTMQPPKWINVRGVEFTEKGVAWIIPFLVEVVVVAYGNGTRLRITGQGGPAHELRACDLPEYDAREIPADAYSHFTTAQHGTPGCCVVVRTRRGPLRNGRRPAGA